MKDKIIKQRRFNLVSRDGHRLFVDAKLYSLGGQKPYFSVTSQNGANHEEILDAFPELEKVVKVHLADQNGAPMHAVENLAFHLQNSDYATAVSHVREAASMEDLMVVAGRAAMKEKEVLAEAEARVAAERKKLEEGIAVLDGRIRAADRDGMWMRSSAAKRDRKKLQEELEGLDSPKRLAREARIGVVREFVDGLKPVWKKQAEEALAFLDGPDLTADGWVSPESDETTFEGFMATRGIAFEVTHAGPSDNPNFAAGARAYDCVFSLDGRSMAVPFNSGSAPSAVEVLRNIADAARFSQYSFREFCDALGHDEDSRSAEKAWKACATHAEELKAFLGADGFRFLMEKVEEDGPIEGREPDAAPSPG